MITTADISADPLARDRLLVVGSRDSNRELVERLHNRFPEWGVSTTESHLSAIADLSSRPARAVFAFVDPMMAHVNQAVAGLREAAGDQTKLLLCCTPDTESLALDALACGADDYLLCPLDDSELDAALGVTQLDTRSLAGLSAAPAATMEELAKLGAILAGLGDHPRELLDKTADLIRLALAARGAMVVVDGAAVTSGETVNVPVLTAAIGSARGPVGRISVAARADGSYTPADGEKLAHYAAVVGHVLDAAELQRKWRRLSATDECSGLPNRRYLHDRLDEILARASTEQFHVTLLLFDIDDFKSYNDEYGHAAGDEIIRTTGRMFRDHCREQDIVARYGGDEFVVVFWDAQGPRVAGSKHPEGALAVLARVTEALKAHKFPFLGPSGAGRLTISGGLATFPWDASTRDDLIKRADDALLAAKRAGKNRIVLIGDA